MDPVYHGDDLAAAYARAAEIRGAIVHSLPPADGTELPPLPGGGGYWSDSPDCFLRGWERLVYTTDRPRPLAALQSSESRILARRRR